MARLPYIDPAHAPVPVREVFERVPALNIFRMLANAETAFRPWIRWGRVLLNDLALAPRLRELAILRVARITPHADYEWVQHVPLAKATGVSDAQVDALEGNGAEADCFSDEEKALLRFTTEVVRDARPSDATFELLAKSLSAREIVELLMVIGQYMMLARVMAATDMELDEPAGPAALGADGEA